MDDTRPHLEPALADRYQLESELGRGGMATVYRARDLKHGRPVALKVLSPEVAESIGTERFEREIRLAARLQHPHICSVYDSGEDAGFLWFTMPFVEGESLAARLERESALPPDEALRIASEAALGLAAAHAKGVIHRDIKPANLLLAADGTTLVADFGIARALGGPGTGRGEAPLTQTGYSPGTPAYMSPEQLAGGHDIDGRTDVYSLGLVLLEMLTGERPGGASGMAAVLALGADTRVALAGEKQHWPPGTVDVIRRAIGLDPAERYQQMADFRAALEALRRGPTAPRRRWRGVMLAGAGVLLALIATWIVRRNSTANAAPARIAVLPLADLSPVQDEAWFSDGLTEELTTQLGRVPALRVAARGSAFQFRGPDVDVREVGRQLDVGTVLTGSVRKQAGRLRVSVQLVDTRAGSELWSETYDRTLADVFAVQSEIAHAVASALQLRLGAPADSALARRATTDLQAYDLFLQGRFAMNQRTEATLPEAVRFFREAVARDSNFSRAWAGLAEAAIVLPLYTSTPPDSVWPLARAAGRRAITLDPALAEAHTALGYGTMLYEWDWPAAERSFRAAIAADPDYATAHHWYADFLAGRNRLEEALGEIRRARELDPLSRIIGAESAWMLHLLHREEEGDGVIEEILRLDPNFAHAYIIQGQIRLAQNRPREALALLQQAVALGGFNLYTHSNLIATEVRLGNRSAATALLDSLHARARREYVAPFGFAAAYAQLGDMDRAYQWLERGIREKDVFLPENFFEALFDPVRKDPRYPAVERVMRGE